MTIQTKRWIGVVSFEVVFLFAALVLVFNYVDDGWIGLCFTLVACAVFNRSLVKAVLPWVEEKEEENKDGG